MDERYQGAPMLILLENLILHAIGMLDSDAYARLHRIEPHLQQTFGQSLTWDEIVKAQLELHSEFENEVRDLWRRASAEADAHGLDADAVQFARAIADDVSSRRPG